MTTTQMTTDAAGVPTVGPILIELDAQAWAEQLDATVAWFDNLLMIQATFRDMAADTAGKIREPHIKKYITDIAEAARGHEEKARELYQAIGREPAQSGVRTLGGTLLSKVSQVVADLQGAASGAVGNWGDIRQLLLTNLDSMGAFGVAEQLGLALGLPAIVDITFPILNEKSTQQLLLQEYMLEMAPKSILYKASI